jgi:hypothetical protein
VNKFTPLRVNPISPFTRLVTCTDNLTITEIIAFREFLFKNSPHRDHSISQVFVFGEDDLQLMVLGAVQYNFEDGSIHERQWAGRYQLTKDHDGKLKFKKAQIIIVSPMMS